MKPHWSLFLLGMAGILMATRAGICQTPSAVPLPPGVKAVWDMNRAYRETTPTRERICINGLWRWQPGRDTVDKIPAEDWGYFKVPGCWPGITDYMQKDFQAVFVHPNWKSVNLGGITSAWYQREITIPKTWEGRKIFLDAEYVNSYALVYVDGKKAGELRFPADEVELTALCRPGGKHVLSMLVVALPLKGVMLSYTDSASAREVRGTVERRGLCGDVTLIGREPGAHIADVKVDTSVRKGEITFEASLPVLRANGAPYTLHARIEANGRPVAAFTSKGFKESELKANRLAYTAKWKPDRLWDLHTPQNLYRLHLSLRDKDGRVLDTAFPVRFGFREFGIKGRDFTLNGSRIFLSAVPLDNAQVGAALATYEGAKESLLRLKSFGINFVYTHNYGCEPGSHLSFAEILRAADDVGMLVALSQPHFSHYEWDAPDADKTNGYARDAEFYVRVAQNHPSVVAYSMSHNATGYNEDMNPDMIDGIHDDRDQWASKNARLALRAEAIVKQFDSRRIVYHHAGGNIGALHSSNFYPNFAPIQELSDWFEHWSTKGVKPAFLCEYGAPFTWDWTLYRGWYKGEREFGSARVPWEFCLAEWNAQFLGDRAYRITEMEKKNLRWEAGQFRAGNLWHRWDYPYSVSSDVFDDRHSVIAMYLADNWRAFRTWEVSGISPWEHDHFWKLREGVDRSRKNLKVDWENLQRPGFSPDYLGERYERMDLAFERSDWIPTADAQALLRNNRPLLAYIGGKPSRFTSKDHNFEEGETVEKQLIIINNSRQTVTCDCEWSLGLPQPLTGSKKVRVPTGEQQRIPLRFELPHGKLGTYPLTATVRFSNGETQKDLFAIDIVPEIASVQRNLRRIAIFDPKEETYTALRQKQVNPQIVQANADFSPYDVLIIGKGALTVDGPGPDLSRVREGLKVIVFEQTAEVLEKRFGFRVAEYGLRQVFKRVPDHPLLAGLEPENLCDWRGEATILPPRLKYTLRPRHGPTVQWCDIEVAHIWRCGCQGNVASVLIEKPTRGDFLPIMDGGYSLQYSPLMEYREGKGMILFCQLDVSGRTEREPIAEFLIKNIVEYVADWKPAPRRRALYVGDPAGKAFLESSGLSLGSYEGGKLATDQALIVGPGGGQKLAQNKAVIASWLQAGGSLLALGLDETDANAFLPFTVRMKRREHINATFAPFARNSLLAGVSPADVHNRDPRELSLVSGGASVISDGILAVGESASVLFSQLVPWQFDPTKQHNLKQTYRRASFLTARLLANLGVAGSTPLLSRFRTPMAKNEKRWLDGLYLDTPEEWDDPYRFFRW